MAAAEGLTAMGGERVPYYQNYLASQNKRNEIEVHLEKLRAETAYNRMLRDEAIGDSPPIAETPGAVTPVFPQQFDVLNQSGAVSTPSQDIQQKIKGSIDIKRSQMQNPIERSLAGLYGGSTNVGVPSEEPMPSEFIREPATPEWNKETGRFESKPGAIKRNPRYDARVEADKQVRIESKKQASTQRRNLRVVSKTLEQTHNSFRKMRRREREIVGPDVPERVGPLRVMGGLTAYHGATGENEYVKGFKGDLAQSATALVKIVAPSSRAGVAMVKVLKETLPDEWSNLKENTDQIALSLTDAVMRYAADNEAEFPELPPQREFYKAVKGELDKLVAAEEAEFGAIPGEKGGSARGADVYSKWGLER